MVMRMICLGLIWSFPVISEISLYTVDESV
jgi:hypothetical protein